MKKQFIRFYLLSFATFIGFLAAFNALYNAMLVEPANYQLNIEHVFDSYKDNTGIERPTLDVIPLANFALPDALLNTLRAGGVIAVEMAQGEIYYLQQGRDKSQLVRFGPLVDVVQENNVELYFIIVFFCSFALIALWLMKPIFSDLSRLQAAAIVFSKKPQKSLSGIKKSSRIYPLASTFEQMTAQIAELLADQKDMARTMTHEIRTPLARMKFAIELLETEIDPEYKAQLALDISELEKLAGDYLTFSKLEYHEYRLNKSALTISSLFNNCAQKFSVYQHKLNCQFHCGDEVVFFEYESIMLALQNLLSNALRFAQHSISVSFVLQHGNCKLIVEDDGPGIKNDNLQLDDAFVRDTSKQSSSSGYGLGLFIVKKVALWHGGTLTIGQSSTLGGAKLSIIWPNKQ